MPERVSALKLYLGLGSGIGLGLGSRLGLELDKIFGADIISTAYEPPFSTHIFPPHLF